MGCGRFRPCPLRQAWSRTSGARGHAAAAGGFAALGKHCGSSLNPAAPTACPHPLGQAFGLPTCPQARLRRSKDFPEQLPRPADVSRIEQTHRLLDLAAHPCCTCSNRRPRQTVARAVRRNDIRVHHGTPAVLPVFFPWHDLSAIGPLVSRSLHPFVNRRSRARGSKLAPGDRSGITDGLLQGAPGPRAAGRGDLGAARLIKYTLE